MWCITHFNMFSEHRYNDSLLQMLGKQSRIVCSPSLKIYFKIQFLSLKGKHIWPYIPEILKCPLSAFNTKHYFSYFLKNSKVIKTLKDIACLFVKCYRPRYIHIKKGCFKEMINFHLEEVSKTQRSIHKLSPKS